MENQKILTAKADDGTIARALDDGNGLPIVILHPGMNSPERYSKVSNVLSKHYRVIRIYRYQYRLDLKKDVNIGSPCSVADEVNHVLAIVKEIGKPVLLFGHSSGGTIALESLLKSPNSFIGGLIYEPALVTKKDNVYYLSGDKLDSNGAIGNCVRLAREALQVGNPGKALSIFMQHVAHWGKIPSNIAGKLTASIAVHRPIIPCQIDDLEAMETLGYRLNEYKSLNMPLAMIYGEKSIEPNKAMAFAVTDIAQNIELIPLKNQGHNGHAQDPNQLGNIIKEFADKVFSTQ